VHWDKAHALGVTETDIHRAIDRFHHEHRGHKARIDWIEKLEIVTQTGRTVRFNEIADFKYVSGQNSADDRNHPRIDISILYVDKLVFAWVDDDGEIDVIEDFNDLASWYDWAPGYFSSGDGYAEGWKQPEQIGYDLSRCWEPL